MIKRWKIVECSFCHKAEPMEKHSDSWGLPMGWKDIGNRTHLCPRCTYAFYDIRGRYKPKMEEEK